MARVLVTGGTGVLGSTLVRQLAARGDQVMALSRHQPATPVPGVSYLRGDVQTGAGVDAAAAVADTVVHAVSGRRRPIRVEVEGTLTVAAAAAGAGAHLIYISIVGIDAVPVGYYKAKLQSERVVEASGQRWTVLRATQFHDLIDRWLGFPVLPATRQLAFQPVDVGDVSTRLAQLVDAGPSGRVEDFGGPEVLALRELAAVRRRVTGRRARLLPVPTIGETMLSLDEGLHLCPEQRSGTRTWAEWQADRAPGAAPPAN